MTGIDKKQFNLMLVGSSDREKLIKDIGGYLTQILGEAPDIEIVPYTEFNNGETSPENRQSVRGKHVYVISDVNSKVPNEDGSIPKYNDRYEHARLLLSNAKRHRAKTINALFTCFPYSRADKPNHTGNKSRAPRKPTSARLIVDDMENLGVDELITLDIHNPATLEAVKNVYATDLPTGRLIEHVQKIENLQPESSVLFSADAGGANKIKAIAEDLDMKMGINIKLPDYSKTGADRIAQMHTVGPIKDHVVVLHDDILDTSGTFVKTLENLNNDDENSPSCVIGVITHAMLNGPAIERLDDAYARGLFKKLYVTNTIAHVSLPDYIKVIDTSLFFADKIATIAKDESMDYNRNEIVGTEVQDKK